MVGESKKTASQPPERKPVVTAVMSRCPSCGSTDRTKYYGIIEQEQSGLDPSGEPFTHIVRRRTRCGNPACQQMRIDRTYENRLSDGE